MSYRRLLIFCEGADDERFINNVVRPQLSERYDRIRTVAYAQKRRETVDAYLRNSIQQGIDILLLHDLDRRSCITECINVVPCQP